MASQEYYTHPNDLAPVLEVFNRIDLDPCSNPFKSVPAIRHYVGQHGQDGLALPWGESFPRIYNNTVQTHWRNPFTVFVNPPWNNIGPWVEKAFAEYQAGHCTEVIMLLPARTETRWYRQLSKEALTCQPDYRINYMQANEQGELHLVKGIAHASHYFYIGENWGKFQRVFEKIGGIYVCLKNKTA